MRLLLRTGWVLSESLNSLLPVIMEDDMDNLLVILIVTLAGIYIVRTLYKRLKGQEDCGCGCSS